MVLETQDEESGQVTESKLDLNHELEETARALKEITLMIEQSQSELGKLTQRNAAITAYLQQVQNQFDKLPPKEIRSAYDSALETQQRLFVMRGQLGKLQSDKAHLERFLSVITKIRDSGGQTNTQVMDSGGNNGLTSVEMLVNAQEAERQRLSRQMHDGPAQALSNFILQTEIAMRLLDVDTTQARDELGNLKAAAINTFQKVRNFIFELRPMMLDDLGLVPTIRRYADTYKEQTGLDVNIIVSGTERRLEPYLEVLIFRALQELLGNAARHGQANSVKMYIDIGTDKIKISLEDNGKGFDSEVINKKQSVGLKMIQERAEMQGGSFDIDSVLGKGTRVTFTIPTAEKVKMTKVQD